MTPIYRNKRKAFPDDYDPDDCILVGIPCSLVGIFAGKIAELEYRAEWKTDEDWEQGYQAVVRWEAELMSCGQTIAAQLDNLTTLLSEWRVEQGDTLLAIHQIVAGLDTTTTSSLDVQTEIKSNNDQIACALIGTLISLLSQGTINPTIAIGACNVIRAGGSGALDMIQDLITQGLGRNTLQALRGETEPDPSDHILEALRGTTPSGETRNLVTYVDEIETILGY